MFGITAQTMSDSPLNLDVTVAFSLGALTFVAVSRANCSVCFPFYFFVATYTDKFIDFGVNSTVVCSDSIRFDVNFFAGHLEITMRNFTSFSGWLIKKKIQLIKVGFSNRRTMSFI